MAVHAVTLMHCLALLGCIKNPAQSPGQFTKKPKAQKAQKRKDRAISNVYYAGSIALGAVYTGTFFN